MAGWQCTVCVREFVSQPARASHFNNNSRHPRCVPCNRGFLDDASKLQHLRSSAMHNYCEPCQRDFNSLRALEQHRQSAAAHRGEYQYAYRYDSDSDSSMGSLPEVASSYETDHDFGFDSDSDLDFGYDTRSAPLLDSTEADAVLQTAELLFRMNFEHMSRPPQDLPSRQLSSLLETLDNDSSSAGEDGSYLDASSEDDSEEERNEVDSDFLEQSSSSDSDTGASDAPFSLSSDIHRSTITHGSMFGSSVFGLPQGPSAPASASQTSISTATTASSSTLAIPSSGSPSAEKRTPKSRAMGNGYTCPLCLEQDGDAVLELTSVKCGHVFCTPCIRRALEKKHQCPVCRARAKLKDLRRIYLSI